MHGKILSMPDFWNIKNFPFKLEHSLLYWSGPDPLKKILYGIMPIMANLSDF